MNRFNSVLLTCLFGFYASGAPALALTCSSQSYASLSISTEPIAKSINTASSSTSAPIPTAFPPSPSQDAVLQLMQATGVTPDVMVVTQLESSLKAANAPADIVGLAAAYTTNAAIKVIIDSIGTTNSSLSSNSSVQFVNTIFVNVTGSAPRVSGLLFWSNALDSGAITRGDAVLSILAGALAGNTAIDAVVHPIISSTSIPNSTNSITSSSSTTASSGKNTLPPVTESVPVDTNTVQTVNTELANAPSTSTNPVVRIIQNHPVIAAVVATTVIATAIAVSVAVPLGVNALHQQQNRTTTNQQNTLAAVYANENVVKSQQVVSVVKSSGGGNDGGGGYQPP